MTDAHADPLVLIVVPNGGHRAGPLAEAIRRLHPAWRIEALWAGDPHLRPAFDKAIEWCSDVDVRDREWQLAHVSLAAERFEWSCMLEAARRRVGDHAAVIALWAGSIGVGGHIGALLPSAGLATLIARADDMPDDGCSPTADDLDNEGRCSPNAVAFGPSAGPLIEWLAARLGVPGADPVGVVLDQAVMNFAIDVCRDDAVGAGLWRWATDAPRLLDLAGYDPAQPWTLDPRRDHRARIDLVGNRARQAVLATVGSQLAGRRLPVRVPGGLLIDDLVRSAIAESPEPPPAPWSEPGAFRAWLASRYWLTVHRSRADLGAAFPEPTTSNSAGFHRWCRRALVDDDAPLLVGVAAPDGRYPTTGSESSVVAVPARPANVPGGRLGLPGGVNFVGYLSRDLGLGVVARQLLACLEAAGISVNVVDHLRSVSPAADIEPVARPSQTVYRTTLAVVNADQITGVALDHPDLLERTDRLIGYWFWELAEVPLAMRRSLDLVDEVWVGSRFVADAWRLRRDVPVRLASIPITEPTCSLRDLDSFPAVRTVADRFVFATVFDHHSVTERKNPFGAIEAFKRAFAPDEGPVLVVKSMNGDHRWPQHQRVLAAAEGRPDIIVWDEHLERADQMAFIRSVDVLVSLHRSEGLGLHLAEAMWLGTPVIATRYSGNLDFMDDDCAVLIDATLVNVEHGEGVYPPEARWADPDLDQAAAAMRRMMADPQWAADLAAAGRRRMEQQPSLADTGRHIAHLLGLTAPTADGRGVAS
jgi:glycosyltransferase involved in cell wall biosynthesis